MSEQNASEIFEETKNNPRNDVAEIYEEIESDSGIESDSECDDDLDIPIDGIYILII